MNLRKLLLTLFAALFLTQASSAQTIKVQFINNCPDVSVASVDVYVNGTLALDNLNFRTASPFIDYAVTLPANTLTIGIAPATSTAVTDTFFSYTTPGLSIATPHIMVINGLKNTAGYSPFRKMEIAIFANAELTVLSPSNTDYLLSNGSTDLGTINVKSGLSTLASSLGFSQFTTGYNSVITTDFKIRVNNLSGSKTIGTFSTDFVTNGLFNTACVIIASGFVNPASNNNGAAFGLWLATASGGPLVPLSSTSPEPISRAQFINNSADTMADTVDLYIDGNLLYNNFALHTASPFVDYLSKTPMTIAIAPPNSTSASDAFYTLPISLDSGKKYIFVADGIQSATGYTPIIPYALHYTKTALEDAASSSNTDIMFVQGSTDAASIDIKQGSNTLFSGASYASFSSYQSIPTANVPLRLTMGTTIIDYDGDFSTFGMQGQAITLLASGFADPAKNSKGQPFGLWAASPAGGPLKKLNVNTSGINNVASAGRLYTIWPNPATQTLHINGPAGTQILSADVLDVTGKIMMGHVKITNNEMNVSALTAGTYLLHFMQNTQSVHIRFVKE